MQVCVLGPVAVRNDGADVAVGGRQHRRIVARLAMSHGSPVSISAIELALWDDVAPSTARHTIASRVFQLRTAGLTIDTTPAGYVLRNPTDVASFEELLADPASTGVPAARLRAALDLWRGQPYADLDDLPEAIAESARLTDLADEARDELLAVDIDTGDVAAAIAEARLLVADRPYRERRWELLMLALYRTGRQADALAVYSECRRLLVDELGIEPGPGLRRMQHAILSQDPALDRQRAPATPTPDAATTADGGGPGHAAGAGRPRLPGTGTRLVGRGDERRELHTVWKRSRLATVVGPPGAGKTRLALDVAREDARPAWYVALEQVGTDQSVAAAILDTVAPASRAADPVRGLIDALADADGLLLLDGCEARRVEVAHVAAGLLAGCPRLRILATSRERLGQADEALIPVGGLSAEDALDLLVDRARLSDPSFRLSDGERLDAEELCALVDRLPLAIELVARHLQLMTVREVRERVASDVGRWAGRSTDGRPGIWAALAGSFSRLSADELAVHLGLAVMAGEADIALIAAVAESSDPTNPTSAPRSPDATFDVVAGLVDASLVQVRSASGRTRYEVLRTVGRFSRESADPSAVEAAEGRYRRAVVGRAAQIARGLAGPDRAEALDRLDAEMAHVRSVLGVLATADEQGDPTALDGLRLAIALTDYWLSRRPAEGLGFLERLIAAADPPADARAEARLRQAHLAYWIGAFDGGLAMAEEARALFSGLGDAAGEGRAWRRIGAIAAATDDMARARSAHEASLAQLEAAGLDDEVGTTLLHLGSLLADEGDIAAAVPLLERARTIAEARGDPLALGHVLAALNLARWKSNDLEAALEVGELALDRFRQLGHRPTQGTVAYRLSSVARGLGRPAAARRYALLAIEAGEQVQTRTTVALGHVNLARLDLDTGATEAAAEHLRAAVGLHDPAADRWVLVDVLEAVARLVAAEDADSADALLRAAEAHRLAIRQPAAPTDAGDVTRTRALVDAVGPSARRSERPTLDAVAAHALARDLLAARSGAPQTRPALRALPASG